MTAYRYILFDLDGTLTDPAEGITHSVAYALQKMGRPPLPYETLLRFIGPPLYDSFMRFCGMGEAEARQSVVQFRTYFADRGIWENRSIPGVLPMLARLQAAGCTLLVATSKPELFARQVLAHFGMLSSFSFVGGSTLQEERVEKDEVIRYVMAHAALTSPAGCLMVGDREYDVRGAAACGIPAVGVLYGYGSAQELTKAGAVALAHTPADVTAYVLGDTAGGAL